MATKTPDRIEQLRAAEIGTYPVRHEKRIALGYPATYRAGASSLGFQTVYRRWNEMSGLSCERFFMDTVLSTSGPVTLESRLPVRQANAVAFSISCETELSGIASLLDGSGMAPQSTERGPREPPVIIGGPLTFLDPRLVAPFADLVVCGDGEDALTDIAQALLDTDNRTAFLQKLETSPHGIWLPQSGPPPALHRVSINQLPAIGATWSTEAELKNLFLVEIARGCPHRCTFCVLSGRHRYCPVPIDTILSAIPKSAPGVGLVGAAVTDHPHLEDIVERIVETGKRVSLSSMRADRLSDRLLRALRAGGLQSLTIAADGSSERIRDGIQKRISAADLRRAVHLAAAHQLKSCKIYSMIGLPGETEADVAEFAALTRELSREIRITVAIQAFVPKPGTPLATADMCDVKELVKRLQQFRQAVGGTVTLQPTSPRWSWVDWKLCHGADVSARVALEAFRAGGEFRHWKDAIQRHLGGHR